MKKNFLYFLMSFISIGAFAQEAPKNLEDSLRLGYWEPRNTQLAVNFNQTGFNSAWTEAQGGLGNLGIGFMFNHRTVYHKNKGIWSSDMQFQYGNIKNKGQDMRKSIDRIFLDTKYSRKINSKINYFAGANFLSQFASGYAYDAKGVRGKLISNIFAPAFLSEGIGLEYKPVSYFVLQLGGATMRQTFVSNDKVFTNTQKEVDKVFKSYGVEKGNKVLNEMGFQLVAAFDKDIAKNLNLKWRYQGFVAYAPKTKPMDHMINLIATAKVNKYLNVNFTLLGMYDADILKEFQLSEGFAAGLSVKL